MKTHFGRFENLNLTDSEKEICFMDEISNRTASYCRYIGSLKVEFLVNAKGYWSYKMHTNKKTGYETSPGLIESKFRFPYSGKAESAAIDMEDCYWCACNEND